MHSELLLKGPSLRYISNAWQCILNSFLRDRLWDAFRMPSNAFWTPSWGTVFEIHFKIFLPFSFIRGDRRPPLLLGLHLLHLHFTSEMNESLIKHAFFKPCFDTQPMAFPSEVSYSPAAPYRPFPWPSSTQLLHLLLHQNNPSTMQYNWLESVL